MKNPIVEELYYKLVTAGNVSFDNPPKIEVLYPQFDICLESGNLFVRLKEDVKTEKDARQIVEPFLRMWELSNLLNQGSKEIIFEFIKSKIIDKSPPPPKGSYVINLEPADYILFGNDISFHVTRKNYPSPPTDMLYSPDVESLYNRYEGYINGKEPLLSMSYFCLSLIEASVNGRKNASKIYNIDIKILSKIGELTSNRGGMSESRKIVAQSTLIPLNSNEINWLTEAVKLIIRRKAEYDFKPERILTEIKYDDLPKILHQ